MRFILLALAVSLSASADESIKNPNPGIGPITILGDSLAASYGSQDKESTLESCFDRNFEGDVTNFAVPGRTSAGVLQALGDPLKTSPKLVFLSSGGNDAIQDHFGNKYPVERSLREMGEIFDKLLATGAMVIYLGLNPPYEGGARLPMISELAHSKGVLVVDAMKDFWNTDLMADEFHPTDAGYRIMCDRIVEATKSYYP